MNPNDVANWARGRAGHVSSNPPAAVAPPAFVQPQLAPPPPGFMWAQIPGVGLACIPIPQQALPPPIQPHPSVSFLPTNHMRPPNPGPEVETCVLMKPDGRDPYGDLLAQVPSLVPEQGYDATKGRPNPNGAEVRNLPEFHDRGPVVDPDATNPYPTSGQGVPLKTAIPLK